MSRDNPFKISDYPDLPEIMSYGVGLTAALAIWSDIMNTPGMTPDEARAELENTFKASSASARAPSDKSIH